MFRLSIKIIRSFSFLASIALLSSFKVVVLAFAALPTSFRKIELLSLLRLSGFNLCWIISIFDIASVIQILFPRACFVLMMQWFDSSCHLSNFSHFCSLSNGWLGLGYNFKWREENLRRKRLKRVLEGLLLMLIIGTRVVEIVYHNVVDGWCLRTSEIAEILMIYWSLWWENWIVETTYRLIW